MQPLEHDILTPLTEAFALGKPGDWTVQRPVVFWLHDSRLAGLAGDGYRFEGIRLSLGVGYRWDGSSVVPDTEHCLVASAFHDAAYDAIARSDYSIARRWKLRRWADNLYARVARINGMGTPRAVGRYLGLRVFGGVLRRVWVTVVRK